MGSLFGDLFMREQVIATFHIALAAGVLWFISGAVLSFRIRKTNERIYREVGSPPANAWYPAWTVKLMRPALFAQIDSLSQVLSVVANVMLLVAVVFTCVATVDHLFV